MKANEREKIQEYLDMFLKQEDRMKTLLKLLYQLADLDIKIKSGKINKDIALELFILEN